MSQALFYRSLKKKTKFPAFVEVLIQWKISPLREKIARTGTNTLIKCLEQWRRWQSPFDKDHHRLPCSETAHQRNHGITSPNKGRDSIISHQAGRQAGCGGEGCRYNVNEAMVWWFQNRAGLCIKGWTLALSWEVDPGSCLLGNHRSKINVEWCVLKSPDLKLCNWIGNQGCFQARMGYSIITGTISNSKVLSA